MNIKINAVNVLIAINVVMFLLLSTSSTGEEIASLLALHFTDNPEFHFWQPVSYLFLHGSVAHILFNMYGLFAFGTILEQRWGSSRFLQFYFISGIGAAVVYTLANIIQYNSMVDDLTALGLSMQDIQDIVVNGRVENSIYEQLGESRLAEFYGLYHSTAVGASGAIYGILIAFALSFPQAKLMLIFLPFPIAAKYFVPLLIGIDIFFGVTSYSIGNIAHFAHVGGALTGLLMMLWWRFWDLKYSRRF